MAMTLRLSDEETAILRALAEREDRSMHEVVRLAVLERAERTAKVGEMDALLDRATTRYADLLERLSR